MIVFAGGGTGGHIVPALAIADELARRDPASCCCFIHSERPVDARVLRAERWPHVSIPARPLNARPLKLAKGLFALPGARRAARRILLGEHAAAPHRATHLVTLGGFVAPPAVLAARASGVLVTVLNIDAVPGLANRALARFASHRFAAAHPIAGWTTVPPIVRPSLREPIEPADARARLALEPERPTLLVTGGSLGARSLNRFVLAFANEHQSRLRDWQVLHQAGALDLAEVTAGYERLGIRAVVVGFLDSLALAWRSADLAICRGGASTVAELWATGTPAMILPYPFHRDQHQRVNAQPLERAGGVLVATDHIDPARNLAAHSAVLAEVLAAPARRAEMRRAYAALDPPDGAMQIAHFLQTHMRREP